MSLPPVTSLERVPVPAHQAVAKAAAAPVVRKNSTADYVASQASTTPAKAGEKEFSFWDLVDIVNPLQHIPVVNTLYRKMTGDEINGFARVAGGALFGGLAGAAAGTINAVVAMKDGKDIGDTVWAKIAGDDETKIAAKEPVVTVTPADKGDMAGAMASAAPAHSAAHSSAHSSALFDYNLPAKKAPVVKPESPIPVIEVRPEASTKSTDEKTLPPIAAIDQLNDIMPGAAGSAVPSSFEPLPETVASPKDKAAIQRAMMDALIKMQEMEKDGEESASENAAADDITLPTN